ncbi:MAG: cytochrome P450 [Mycobacteriales bacterium]
MTAETVHTELPPLPTTRPNPFDPPADYARLREEAPISRHVWPNGVEAWLVTRHADVRALLSDTRLSVNRFASPPPSLSLGRGSGVMLPKSLIGMDPPEHTPRRQLYVRELTVRKILRLKPRIEAIVDSLVDDVARHDPPVDLVETFCQPIPSLVICELLGVPVEDRADFQKHTQVILGVGSDAGRVQEATLALMDFMRELVEYRRREPGDDILSRLATAEVDGGPLSVEELVGHGMLLLIAGHETTANMIALSVITLLSHPPALAALRADPAGTAARAVEELLRYHAVIQFGLVRKATADIPIGDVMIRAGDWVVCSLASANRDGRACPHADQLDIHRPPARQVSFGHGVHQCAGQNLARVEVQVALTRLFARFPNLRPAVPFDSLPFRTDAWVYGLRELPVTW